MEQFIFERDNAAETDEIIRQSLHRLDRVPRQDWIWEHLKQRLLYAADLANELPQPTAGPEKRGPTEAHGAAQPAS